MRFRKINQLEILFIIALTTFFIFGLLNNALATIFLSDAGWSDPTVGTWDSVTRTATLTEDIDETIQIDSNDITLDGNGHTITGVSTGSGVILNGRSGVTITNLSVKQCSYGISLSSSSNNTLTNNTALSNTWVGIRLLGSSSNTIIGNTASNSSDGYGISLGSSSNNNTLTNNTTSNNILGINLSSSSGNTLDSNTSLNNSSGISLSSSSNNTLIGNTASNNYNGIWLQFSSSSNTLTANIVDSNNTFGIYLANSSNSNILTSNTVTSNKEDGIGLDSSSGNTLTNNTTLNNDYGINLSSANNNTLTYNIASDNNHNGISLGYSNGNTIANNTTSDNKDGISLSSSSGNTLTNNTMSGNQYNFTVSGNSDSDYNNNIDTSNTVDGKPIYYIQNATDQVFDNSTNAGVFYCILCNNVTIKDLSVSKNLYGIFFWKTQNSRIENTLASNNDYGIYLNSSSNNTLTSNIVSRSNYSYYNGYGIVLFSSNNNTLTNNSISDSYCGINLSSANNNNLKDNTASNNVYGIIFDSSSSNTLINNTTSNALIGIYLSFSNENSLISNTSSNNEDGGGIFLDFSSGNTLNSNKISNGYEGIDLFSSNGNTLIGNTISDNEHGIVLDSSSINTLTGNTVTLNNWYGISLYYSSNNKIYSNNFIDNATQAYDEGGSSNVFNLDKPVGGNYWSNWTVPDNDGDGFVDFPYIFSGGQDNLPLAEQNYNSSITPSTGGNAGQVTVTIFGNNFVEGTTAKLICSSQEITGENTVISSSYRLTTTFDLVGTSPGQCDIVVTLPDNSQLLCEDCFTIEQGGEAKLWVEIVGPALIRVGRPSTFIIYYGNSGNIDAPYPWLEIALPSDLSYETDLPSALTPVTPLSQGPAEALSILLADLPTIYPGTSDFVKIKITPTALGEIPIRALIEPYAATYSGAIIALQNSNPLNNIPPDIVLPPIGDPEVACSPNCPDEWPTNSDNKPPAGYICYWNWDNTAGNYSVNGCSVPVPKGVHLAKSIGGGQVIEMWEAQPFCPDLDLRVNWLDSSNPAFKGCYKPFAEYDQSHAEEVVRRARASLSLWGNGGAEWSTDSCGYEATMTNLKSDCIAFTHLLDEELIQQKDKTWIDELFDMMSPSKKWEGFMEKLETKADLVNCPDRYKEMINTAATILISVTSIDPNDKAGPVGFDFEGTPVDQLKKYIAGDHSLGYMVFFENLETATAPAQEVLITDQLDENLDWTTFSFGQMQIGNKIISVPENTKNFTTTVDLRPDMPSLLDIDCNLVLATGVFECLFRGKDPDTGELADLLPPNTDEVDPKGRGWISYSVMPKPNLPTGTVITNQSTIDFEVDIPPDPMDTPEVFNTIDSGIPTSNVLPLASKQTAANFTVSWNGIDDTGGSGIKNYDIYVSDNGSLCTLWITTSETSATFTGLNGHQYSFYSRARDNVGNIEDPPEQPDSTTIVEVTTGILGDINKDGAVDISDVILVLRCSLGLPIDPYQCAPCGDINKDVVIDISDVILTLRMALGIDPLKQCAE